MQLSLHIFADRLLSLRLYGFKLFAFFLFLWLCSSCTTVSVSDLPPEQGIERIRKKHDNKEWQEVISEVDLFKTRYPYSAFTVEAELLQADSYFMRESYSEAVASYEDFLRKNPHNENVSIALFRIARSYDLQSPLASDREQIKTYRAVEKYKQFIELFPHSDLLKFAIERIHILKEKLLDHNLFVTHFYLKKQKYSAALLRAEKVLHQF
ncbi:MAG: outer membrane protein assembly factor BamD, partial [Silvanigrellaceae bacterium]|nr:outer membrane protein assembly factor BamD [Silvanigrellaceae bacterium]